MSQFSLHNLQREQHPFMFEQLEKKSIGLDVKHVLLSFLRFNVFQQFYY